MCNCYLDIVRTVEKGLFQVPVSTWDTYRYMFKLWGLWEYCLWCQRLRRRDDLTEGTHSVGPTCSLPGTEKPQLCLIYTPFFWQTAHCVFKTHPKIYLFHLVLVVLKRKKSGGLFYSIYEKERVMCVAWWSIIYEWKEAFVNPYHPLFPLTPHPTPTHTTTTTNLLLLPTATDQTDIVTTKIVT